MSSRPAGRNSFGIIIRKPKFIYPIIFFPENIENVLAFFSFAGEFWCSALKHLFVFPVCSTLRQMHGDWMIQKHLIPEIFNGSTVSLKRFHQLFFEAGTEIEIGVETDATFIELFISLKKSPERCACEGALDNVDDAEMETGLLSESNFCDLWKKQDLIKAWQMIRAIVERWPSRHPSSIDLGCFVMASSRGCLDRIGTPWFCIASVTFKGGLLYPINEWHKIRARAELNLPMASHCCRLGQIGRFIGGLSNAPMTRLCIGGEHARRRFRRKSTSLTNKSTISVSICVLSSFHISQRSPDT
jgi:hypothetical protein